MIKLKKYSDSITDMLKNPHKAENLLCLNLMGYGISKKESIEYTNNIINKVNNNGNSIKTLSRKGN